MNNNSLLTPTQLIINPNITPNPSLIIGVDEVGRGCLFGEMTVAACILPIAFAHYFYDDLKQHQLSGTILSRLGDSKGMNEKTRNTLSDTLKTLSSYAIVDVSASLIDELNIHQATMLGMKSAILALRNSYPNAQIFIDGAFAPNGIGAKTLIKGDEHHASIAAASILAKVHRDHSMIEYAKQYPNYALDKHKGYPTLAHKKAIDTYGVLFEHRKSYKPIQDALKKNLKT